MESEMLDRGEVGRGEEMYGSCLSSFVDDGSQDSHRLFLARRTVMEMIRDRGYSVPDSEINLTLTQFRAIHGNSPDVERLGFSTNRTSNPSDKILVIFCGSGPVKVNTVRSILTQIGNKNTLKRLILILQGNMTSQAQKAVDLFSFKVEIFQIRDLLVNITKHMLKPKHVVLNRQEKQKLLKKYNVQENQLPRMLEDDPIARYYGLEKGQIVKVTYRGEITETHVTYRCVW